MNQKDYALLPTTGN